MGNSDACPRPTTGGCWSSLEAAWPRTRMGSSGWDSQTGSLSAPARGPIADAACGQLADVFIDTTWPAAACIGCKGSLCAREGLEWASSSYENFWRVPARTLLATAGAGESRRRPKAGASGENRPFYLGSQCFPLQQPSFFLSIQLLLSKPQVLALVMPFLSSQYITIMV
jgi:hypothetical protein